MITVRLQFYNNSARALLLAAEVMRNSACFFSSILFPLTFLILVLQTASYTHTRMLTDADLLCSPIDSDITHKVKKT